MLTDKLKCKSKNVSILVCQLTINARRFIFLFCTEVGEKTREISLSKNCIKNGK